MASKRQFRGIVFLGVLISFSAAVRSHMHEEASAKYKRDTYKLLERFSLDESMLHSRHRRQATETLTDMVLKIEDMLDDDDATTTSASAEEQCFREVEREVLAAEYCYTSNADIDAYKRIHLDPCPVKYRKINGECNNLANRLWGRSGHPTLRMLDPIYRGIARPAEYDKSAREVSLAFVGNEILFDEYSSCELVMHMGQFIDHDLALTPHLEAKCTGCEKTRRCRPIHCNTDDPLCGAQGCMNFTRSRPIRQVKDTCGSPKSKKGPRAHPNTITSFLDASNVYGSYLKTSRELRTFKGGKLSTKTVDDPNTEDHIHLLPDDVENKECSKISDEKHCGKGGDIRAAEQPVLTALHTLFVHEHNRIAHELAKMHEYMTDEKLFQETRRILIAIMQKIVYGEWLPIVLGGSVMEHWDLGLWNDYSGYDETIDPTISNEFASAFFRFGHSMVPENLKRVTSTYEDTHEDIPLREAFFNASVTHDLGNGGINSLIRGTLEKKLLAIDRHFSASITKHLFEGIHSLDLVALNIQRGRDHGLPGYMAYREHCGLPTATLFEELRDLEYMDEEAVDALSKVYSSAAEIEPFVGMLAERHRDGALVGDTLACILGIQFQNLKFGDRFWFENLEGEQAFSADQLEAIENITMARVICDNVKVDEIQPAAFKQVSEIEGNDVKFYEMINSEAYPNEHGQLNSFVNNRVKCDDYDKIPKLSLDAWRTLEDDMGPDVIYDDDITTG